MKVQRRNFLLGTLAAAAGAASHALGQDVAPAIRANTTDILDVAIVGGGVSGLYSGWRLLTEAKGKCCAPQKVALFEGSRRLGGRLLSVIPPGIPDTRVELGGMRYTPGHKRVAGLVDHLGLKHDDFPVSEPENIAYVRGKMLRHQDLFDADAVPYNLAPDERGANTLADFTAFAARRVVRVILGKDEPLEKVNWATIGLYQGQPLSDLPLRYVIQRSISEEALKFAEDTSGYDSILHTWNAADGLPWNLADFGQMVGFFHLHEGFAALPLTIAELFEKGGGAVHLQHRLKSFDQATLSDKSIGIELHFVRGDGTTETVLARQLILAMPRRALELLDQTGAVLAPTPENARVHQLIKSVTPIPLFKLAICYPFAWWKTLDPVLVKKANGTTKLARITHGQSITDLPVRQCYYWAKNEQSQNAAVLIYDDGSDRDFWAGLRDREQSEAFESGAALSADGVPLPAWYEHKAPRLMVEEAHRQLLVMHGVRNRLDIPEPYAAAYRDWGEDPFGGGANFWHLHVKSKEVSRDILQPKPLVPVYICGEAYSHDQGWVEGSLATADEMLDRHFGLQPPAWLR